MKKYGFGCLGFLVLSVALFLVKTGAFSTRDFPSYKVYSNKVDYKYFSLHSYMVQTRILQNADPETFEYINNSHARRQTYGKDSRQVYNMGLVIEGADPKTFVLLGGNIGRDSKAIYRGVDMISDDPDNFRVEGSLRKDSKYVYKFKDTIHGADPATYKEIKGRFAMGIDKNHVFCYQKPVPNSDPKSFRLLGTSFWKDRTGVYNRKCKKIDMDQRTVISLKKGTNYFRDKDHIYTGETIIPDANRASFRVLNAAFAKDKNNVFHYEKIVDGADRRTFKVLDSYYAKDKDHVYYCHKKIIGADVETFRDTLFNQASNYKEYKDKYGRISRGKRKPVE